jgi:hypothetical protein
MPDEVSYEVLNVPPRGITLAASRNPRLQPSVPAEYGDFLSREVARGEWSVDPQNGEPLNSKGQTVQQHLEFCITTRPHWLMPVAKGSDDEAEKVWLSGNITLQGQRLLHLQKFCNSKAGGLAMWNEEAERFGAKAGSTLPGTLPDGKGDKKPAETLSTNPWSKNFRGDEAERTAKIASIINVKGTKFADALAKSAGTTVFKPLRK